MEGKNILSLIISLVLFIFLISCGPKAQAPLQQPETGLRPEIEQALPDKASEWDRLLSLARKEGKIVVYGSHDSELASAFRVGLKSRYGLDVESVTGRAAEITVKLVNERRAGIYHADVYIGGGGGVVNELIPYGALAPFPELLIPEVQDPKVWWDNNLAFLDKGKMALAMVANPSPSLFYNTNIIRREEINSYRDLLNPKWKGKILINDPTTPGSAQYWFAVASNIMGVEYMRELARMEPMVTRDQRLQVEWLAHGKFPIAIAVQTTTVTEFKKAGAALDQFIPVEGTHLTSSSGNIAMINKAPHPRAAQVFINWLLTKEGQTIYSQITGQQSARIDVPTEHMDQDKVRQPGVEYFSAINEDFIKTLPEHARIAREIFGPLMK